MEHHSQAPCSSLLPCVKGQMQSVCARRWQEGNNERKQICAKVRCLVKKCSAPARRRTGASAWRMWWTSWWCPSVWTCARAPSRAALTRCTTSGAPSACPNPAFSLQALGPAIRTSGHLWLMHSNHKAMHAVAYIVKVDSTQQIVLFLLGCCSRMCRKTSFRTEPQRQWMHST